MVARGSLEVRLAPMPVVPMDNRGIGIHRRQQFARLRGGDPRRFGRPFPAWRGRSGAGPVHPGGLRGTGAGLPARPRWAMRRDRRPVFAEGFRLKAGAGR